jgi:hypothetical protein
MSHTLRDWRTGTELATLAGPPFAIEGKHLEFADLRGLDLSESHLVACDLSNSLFNDATCPFRVFPSLSTHELQCVLALQISMWIILDDGP